MNKDVLVAKAREQMQSLIWLVREGGFDADTAIVGECRGRAHAYLELAGCDGDYVEIFNSVKKELGC